MREFKTETALISVSVSVKENFFMVGQKQNFDKTSNTTTHAEMALVIYAN